MNNGLPQKIGKISSLTIDSARINNQFVLSGSNPDKIDPNIILFLEYVKSSMFTIRDKDNNIVGSEGMQNDLNMAISPIRLDGGCRFEGNIEIAKGFFVQL